MNKLRDVFETEPRWAAAEAALGSVEEPAVDVEPIHRGNRKRTAVVRFAGRGPVVLQVCDERTWLRTEAALLREIRGRTFVPVPPVLTAGSHNGVAYMLTAYVAGADLHERFATVNAETRRDLAYWFGKALARLHEAFEFDGYGRLLVSEGEFRTEHTDWNRWFRQYGLRAVERLPDAFDPLRDDLRALFEEIPVSDAAPRLFPWDFRPGNALVADGSVTAVLDWEAPLAAPPELSVAKSEYLVADWYVDDPGPLREAFRSGYSAVRGYPSIHPACRVAAIAESAVDSSGVVTNPQYPPVGWAAAVDFHWDALESVLSDGEIRYE
ncbi:phosphotransferase family protein [Natranaeroarchaeum sulfidigenes]|uniref:Putative aminoglycoside phosphotransferase n=1 Tax=Natranaeroarchaeum sulfidigenes TaxID=2784880 RepID=A0A897MWN4_9EURY|nr:phosphotransferase [Natranaeroarchaeum sulfidigenes]QSG03513.1 putative aminoglycoside phosphotransferase [Natranaeroarchaeum sulfidigenes]